MNTIKATIGQATPWSSFVLWSEDDDAMSQEARRRRADTAATSTARSRKRPEVTMPRPTQYRAVFLGGTAGACQRPSLPQTNSMVNHESTTLRRPRKTGGTAFGRG